MGECGEDDAGAFEGLVIRESLAWDEVASSYQGGGEGPRVFSCRNALERLGSGVEPLPTEDCGR